jgi:tight adherence protein C
MITNLDLITLIAFAVIAVSLVILGIYIVNGKQNQPETYRRPLIFGELTHQLAAMLPIQFESPESLSRELMRAGYYHRDAQAEFLATRNTLVVGWLVLVVVALFAVSEPGSRMTTPVLVLGLVVAVMMFSVPRLVLQAQASARLRRIQTSLPDSLDMLTMTMMGGIPLPQAMDHVSRELSDVYPDLSCEFGILRRHIETSSLEQGLERFANRIDVPDVQSLAALVAQTERLGANVGQAFSDYADNVRRNRRQRAEAHGNRASIAMILPIVLCLAPPIYILLVGPALLDLRKFILEGTRRGGILRPDVNFDELSSPGTGGTGQSNR